MAKFTKKAFREFLNKQEQEIGGPLHRHGVYHQRKRAYGDYLYFQDRDKFDVDFAEWVAKQVQQ
jgi:hypothetical protein